MTVADATGASEKTGERAGLAFMGKQESIELEGTVSELLPNAMFRVSVPSGHEILTTLAGNMRRNRIRVLAGDRVTVEVSPYDLSRGRITFRHKN